MWQVSWYEKIGDQLLGELILKNIDLLELKQIFSVPLDEPMIYVYPISEIHQTYLQKKIDQEKIDYKINLNKYDYFIEKLLE
jgi:hypothetical protein